MQEFADNLNRAPVANNGEYGLDGLDISEVDAPRPAGRETSLGWSQLVRPLAARIAALEGEKCIRIKKRLAEPIVSSLRHVLQAHFGYRLVFRSRPGETYFWRGEQMRGALDDLRKSRGEK